MCRYTNVRAVMTSVVWKASLVCWCMMLLSFSSTEANHYQWWTCRSECRRCIRRTTPLEKWISEYYSGLFSREPPVAFYDSSQVNQSPSGNPGNHGNPGNPKSHGNPGNHGPGKHGNPGSHGNPGHGYPPNTGHSFGNSHQYGCCETVMQLNIFLDVFCVYAITATSVMTMQLFQLAREFGHWAPNITEFGGRRYTVVHLKQEYQFIPVGRCRIGTTCQQGECVQILRAHWILVYNNSKPMTSAPVSFVPIKIPSHCECLNIGRARP